MPGSKSPARVPITKPFERRHAHAGIDAASVLDRSNAGPVAQMTGNDPQLFRWHMQLRRRRRASRARG